MEQTYTRIKELIESKKCPLHDQSPIITINDDDLNIHCCCKEFKQECMTEIKDIIEAAVIQKSREVLTNLNDRLN